MSLVGNEIGTGLLLRAACFDFCSANIVSSVIGNLSTTAQFGCHYPLMTYLRPYGMFPQSFFFLSACFSKNWKSFTNPNLIFVNDKNIDALHMGIFPEGRWSIHGCFSYLSELLICAEDL